MAVLQWLSKIAKKIMIKYFYFILLSLLVSCSSTGIKLVDEYYIYPPDEYYNSYYLKCKLSSDNDPIIDSVHIVYWNDSTIIIERKAKHDNWIINAFDNNLKCCNNVCCTTKWFSFTHVYIHSFSDAFPTCVITEYWAEFPVLHSRS